MPWRYEGVLHEYLTCDAAGAAGQLKGLRMRRNHDGARRKDPQSSVPPTGCRGSRTRAADGRQVPFSLARYRFYLAQSYDVSCKDWSKALEHYLAHGCERLKFWQEVASFSLYCAAQMKELLRHSDRDVIDAYLLRRHGTAEREFEALHGASRLCRLTRITSKYIALRNVALEYLCRLPMRSSFKFWISTNRF